VGVDRVVRVAAQGASDDGDDVPCHVDSFLRLGSERWVAVRYAR
jgi:hypothetical protein